MVAALTKCSYNNIIMCAVYAFLDYVRAVFFSLFSLSVCSFVRSLAFYYSLFFRFDLEFATLVGRLQVLRLRCRNSLAHTHTQRDAQGPEER